MSDSQKSTKWAPPAAAPPAAPPAAAPPVAVPVPPASAPAPTPTQEQQIKIRIQAACSLVASDVGCTAKDVLEGINPLICYQYASQKNVDLTTVIKEAFARSTEVIDALRKMFADLRVDYTTLCNSMDWFQLYDKCQGQNVQDFFTRNYKEHLGLKQGKPFKGKTFSEETLKERLEDRKGGTVGKAAREKMPKERQNRKKEAQLKKLREGQKDGSSDESLSEQMGK